jgi:hypothetical protein
MLENTPSDETADFSGVDAYALDANAVAGMLVEIFGRDMTVVASRCAHCGNSAQIGTLRAYVGGPGVVLRCSACAEMVMRFVRRPDGTFLVDARGAASIAL